MRGCVFGLALALGACGRLGFDGRAPPLGAGASTIDAAPDAPACTQDCLLADSKADFSTLQNQNGWFYGSWDAYADADGTYEYATDFRDLSNIDGYWHVPGWVADETDPHFSWCYIAPWGGHPDDAPRQLPIRRWVSPTAGPARVNASHSKSDTSGGDGTRALVMLDGAVLWDHTMAGDDGVGATVTLDVELAVGSTLDYMLDPLAGDARDTTNHDMTIQRR